MRTRLNGRPLNDSDAHREPVDALARRIIHPYKSAFLSRSEMRIYRDSFEHKCEQLKNGVAVKITASDRHQIHKIITIISTAKHVMTTEQCIAFAAWVLDLQTSTAEFFYNDWKSVQGCQSEIQNQGQQKGSNVFKSACSIFDEMSEDAIFHYLADLLIKLDRNFADDNPNPRVSSSG